MKKNINIINHRNSERIKELHMKTRLFSKTGSSNLSVDEI